MWFVHAFRKVIYFDDNNIKINISHIFMCYLYLVKVSWRDFDRVLYLAVRSPSG